MLPASPPDPDAAIRGTDTDAAHARISAIKKGYLQDDFAPLLTPRSHLLAARPPLINHGTYVRSTAIDALVEQWLSVGGYGLKKQIVSLGAGSDSRFWRLSTGPLKGSLHRYVELDLPQVTTRKAQAIRKSKDLSACLGESVKLTSGGQGLSSAVYSLCPLDLRKAPAEVLAPLLEGGVLDRSVPTLFIAECVLVYMDQSASDALLRWFSDTFSIVAGLVYEMFGLTDGFGKVMKENLKARQVALPGVDAYPTLESQAARFTNNLYDTAHSVTLRTIRQRHISPAELERISKLELLDEIEELDLVLVHYALSWGVKVDPSLATETSPLNDTFLNLTLKL